jgi:hypothetical protein
MHIGTLIGVISETGYIGLSLGWSDQVSGFQDLFLWDYIINLSIHFNIK